MELPDDQPRSDPVIGCLISVIGFFLVVYALFGLFVGYLIIPEVRSGQGGVGKEIIIEGTPARIGGGSFILMYLGLFLTSRRNYLKSSWMKPTAIALLGCGAIGLIVTFILHPASN